MSYKIRMKMQAKFRVKKAHSHSLSFHRRQCVHKREFPHKSVEFAQASDTDISLLTPRSCSADCGNSNKGAAGNKEPQPPEGSQSHYRGSPELPTGVQPRRGSAHDYCCCLLAPIIGCYSPPSLIQTHNITPSVPVPSLR